MTTETPDTATGWRELMRPALISRFAFLCLGIWLNAADTLVTVTLTPTIAGDIGGFQYFGWSVAAFLLGAIVSGVCSGRLSLELGLRPAIAVAGVAYAVGCATSALAPGFLVFVIGRLVQGLGAGAISALCYVAINAIFPQRLWVRVLSALAGVWGVATLLGPLIGGLFAQADWWRGAFWFFAAQGLLFVAATFFLIRRSVPSDEPRPRIPLKQLLVLGAGVSLIAAAGITGSLALDAALGVGGLASVWLLLKLDARAGGVLLPKAAGDLTTAAGTGYFVIFALEASTIGVTVYGPAFVQTLHHASPLVAGYVITAIAAGWTVVALAVSGIQNRDRLMIRLGATGVAAGLIGAAWALPYGNLLTIVAAMTLIGAGFGGCWAFLSKAIISSLSDAERPLGSSAVPTAQMIGGSVGAAAASAVAGFLGFANGVDPVTGPAAGLWLFGAFAPVALAAWAAAWRLGRLA
ncbi:MAG: MFS transporter [Pseudomonadota bacterium]